jgi:hypothetical protein
MPRARRAITAAMASAFCAAMMAAAPGGAPAALAGQRSGQVTEDAVIPPDPAPAAIEDQVKMAGATGFLHQYKWSSQYLWTDYATGQTVTVPALTGLGIGGFLLAGGDSVAIVKPPTASAPGDVSDLDLPAMTTRHWAVPASTVVRGVAGSSVFLQVRGSSGFTYEVMTFAQDGTGTVTPVTGLPAGGNLASSQPVLAAPSAIVIYVSVSGAGIQEGLLDMATGTYTTIPGAGLRPPLLSADHAGFYDSGTETVTAYSRAGLESGSDTAAQVVTLAGASGTYEVALAGEHVIAVPATAESQLSPVVTQPALDVPLSGAAAGQALAAAETGAGAIAQAPDGVLLVGGTGPADWSVRRLAGDGGGSVTQASVLPLTGPMTNAGLTISQGVLRHIEGVPVPGGPPRYLMFNHELVADSGSGVMLKPSTFPAPLDGLPCIPGGTCLPTADGNWYGTSFLAANTATTMKLREVDDGSSSTMSLPLPSAGGTIADAAISFVIVNGVSPARQYVVDVGHEQILSSGPVTGAGLWFDTLWRSAGPGQLQAADLDTKVTAKPVSTGANCTATEIQATERWVYWSCGPSGPAGVYDQRNRVSIPVPAGPMLLGDGYLVQHDSTTGELNMYDVHADAVAAPVVLATVPAGPVPDDRNITWAVDKYSGDVAYAAADDSVHVVSAAVPATPAAITFPLGSWRSGSLSFGSLGPWNQVVLLSRPVTSWQLTIHSTATTKVAHAQSGGAVRGGVRVDWDGRLPDGAKAYSGPYSWSLSVTTADSATSATMSGGTVLVLCGQIPYRSYDCNGMPGVLADAGGNSGESDWFTRSVNGVLADNGYTDNWPLCFSSSCVSAIVPFGDFNGDGYGDILVKYRSGQLRAYLGLGSTYFNAQSVKSVSLGSGWNAYNAFAYPGDLNGDGKPDLVARDSAGRLWLFASTGNSKFRGRVQVSGSWGGYARLVGAGDLTGDGNGDLLAIDKSGVMWLLAGNGHGGFAGRQRVSAGWSGYNAVIGIGDLSLDGCNDLIARDRQGNLYRFNGNCRGGFASPVKISGGWAKWQGVF